MKRTPAIDHNPDRIRCTVCGNSAGLARRLQTVIGVVCEYCYDGAAPDSAPYWRDYARTETPGQRTTLGHGR
jgi:hypothetical protein